jgi:hypothetical protein
MVSSAANAALAKARKNAKRVSVKMAASTTTRPKADRPKKRVPPVNSRSTTTTAGGRLKKSVPGTSYAGTETDKKSINGMAPPKEVKKAVKKTATAAKKTVKRAVSAVKKAVKKRSATAGGGRAAEAGRKSWYT